MFNNLFDYAANAFGSFNRGDGATIVVVVSVVLLIIAIGLAAYGASRKPETIRMQIIMGIGTIVGFFAFVGVASATLSSIKTSEQTTNYETTTKISSYVNVYAGDGSDVKIIKTDVPAVMTLKQWSSEDKHKIDANDIRYSGDQPYDTLVLSIKGHDHTYYRPITTVTFASNDAKEAFDDWDARGFLTPTITSVDEANLEVIVHNNNLKQSKTIKTANVAITYSFSDDNRKRYQDYLAERDIAARKAQFRENLKDAANDDSLWQ